MCTHVCMCVRRHMWDVCASRPKSPATHCTAVLPKLWQWHQFLPSYPPLYSPCIPPLLFSLHPSSRSHCRFTDTHTAVSPAVSYAVYYNTCIILILDILDHFTTLDIKKKIRNLQEYKCLCKIRPKVKPLRFPEKSKHFFLGRLLCTHMYENDLSKGKREAKVKNLSWLTA